MTDTTATARPDEFAIDVVRDRRQLTIALAGELDLLYAPALREALHGAFWDGDDRAVVVDLEELAFIDSSGIAVLVFADQQALEEGISFTVRATAGSAVDRALRLAGVSGLLRYSAANG